MSPFEDPARPPGRAREVRQRLEGCGGFGGWASDDAKWVGTVECLCLLGGVLGLLAEARALAGACLWCCRVLVRAPALAREQAGVGEVVALVDGLEVLFGDAVAAVTTFPAEEATDVHYVAPPALRAHGRPLSIPARRGDGGSALLLDLPIARWSVFSMLAGRSVSLY